MMKHLLLLAALHLLTSFALTAQINAEAAYYAEDAGYFINLRSVFNKSIELGV